MKTAMKKLFSLMLVAVLLVSVFPMPAAADGILWLVVHVDGVEKATSKYTDTFETDEQILSEANRLYPGVFPENYTYSIEMDPSGIGADIFLTTVVTCTQCGETGHTVSDHCTHCGEYGHSVSDHCTNCGEYGHSVSDHCTNCGEYGHSVSDHCTNCGEYGHSVSDHCTHCGEYGHSVSDHCTNCGEYGHSVSDHCTDCGKYDCECLSPATILIRAKKASDAGYPDGGSFTVAAGTHGVTAIFEAANFSGNVEGYSVSDSNGNGVRRAGENIELAEGGTYILWIELKEESSGNTGSGNTGSGDTGSGNTGSGNTGSGNTGSGNTGSGNTGSGTPGTPDPAPKEKVTLTIDPNFKGAKTYSQKFEKGAKMSDVLKAVGIPSRRGYKFAGWHWDERGRDPVSNREVLSGNDTIYAQWDRKEKAEIILKIYVNGNTESAAKIVDMYEYARDNEIEISEAKEVVKKYYTAKDADGMTIYGVFDSQNWKAFVRNKNNDGAKSLDINRDEDTVVYVMVHNVKTYSTSTAKADASNPKTGDMIYNAAIIMVASVGSLATLYYLNKKRGIQ